MDDFLPEAVEWVHKHKSYSERGRWVCKRPCNYPGVLRATTPGGLISAVDRFIKQVRAEQWRRRIGV